MSAESEPTLETLLELLTTEIEQREADPDEKRRLTELVHTIRMRIRTEEFLSEFPSVMIEGSGLNMELAKEAFEFRKTLNSESDRACALMAAAYLELQLEKLIKAFLVADDPVVKRLLDPLGPFGNFSSKIDITYLLGLIPRLVKRDLHLLRKIRNDFAHTYTQIDFTDPVIAARCYELNYHGLPKVHEPRRKFIRVTMGMMAFIHAKLAATEHTQQMDEPNTENIKAYMDRRRDALRHLAHKQSDNPELQGVLNRIAESME